MNVPRPSRVVAIARRDLVRELGGTRGLLFWAVTLLLLIPSATVRIDLPDPKTAPPRAVWVSGEVPEAVLALPHVHKRDRHGFLAFKSEADGTLVVRTQELDRVVRSALDGDTPELAISLPLPEPAIPGRTILFALISASVLTGAVSESIGGERSQRTLQALLSASVTRDEVVLGKWLAWAGYGALAGLGAALLALALGRVELGWWLLPMPTVAGGTVALAMYLSRHATDVVGGAAVSLRYLPAVLAGTGLLAWFISDDYLLLAAALPIGGALIAAGDTWGDPLTAVIATLSTLGFSAAAIAVTARSLERPAPPPYTLVELAKEAGFVAFFAAISWWTPLAAPLLWGAAGNPIITDNLPRWPGVLAGAAGLLVITGIRAGRVLDPLRELSVARAPAVAWVAAIATGAALALIPEVSALVPMPEAQLLADARLRISAGLQPTWAGPLTLLTTILGQELLFRGWLQRLVGPVIATLAFVLVTGPLDPLYTLLVGGSLAALTAFAGGSILPALGARLVWALAALVLPPVAAGPALALGLVMLAVLAGVVRTGHRTTPGGPLER